MNRRFNVYRRDSDRDDAILFYSFFFFFLKTRKEQGLLFKWTKIYRDQSGNIEMWNIIYRRRRSLPRSGRAIFLSRMENREEKQWEFIEEVCRDEVGRKQTRLSGLLWRVRR